MKKLSPLKYPGSKSRATKSILSLFPKDFSAYIEPFCGSCSIALAMSCTSSVPIWINDIDPNLQIFWSQLKSNGHQVISTIKQLKKNAKTPAIARQMYLEQRQILIKAQAPKLEKAVAFFFVNRLSYMGLMTHDAFVEESLTTSLSEKAINRLSVIQPLIQSWKITNWSYENILKITKDAKKNLIYLDPPYESGSQRLYGFKGKFNDFNHDKLAIFAKNSNSQILISYNCSPKVLFRYPKWIPEYVKVTYAMSKKVQDEVYLRNYCL